MCKIRGLKVDMDKSKVMMIDGEERSICEVFVDGTWLKRIFWMNHVQMILNVLRKWWVGGELRVLSDFWWMLWVCKATSQKRWIDSGNDCLKKKLVVWMLDKQGEWCMIGLNDIFVRGNAWVIVWVMNFWLCLDAKVVGCHSYVKLGGGLSVKGYKGDFFFYLPSLLLSFMIHDNYAVVEYGLRLLKYIFIFQISQ